MQGGKGWRYLVPASVVGAALVVLVAGCSVGPAANRAAHMAPPEPTGQISSPPDGNGGGTNAPQPGDSSSPPPTPEVIPPADVPGAIVDGTPMADGLGNPCCFAELPGGAFLVGYPDSWTLDQVSPDGERSPAGDVRDSSVSGEQGGILGLAVDPSATAEDDFAVYVYFTNTSSNWIVAYTYDPTAPEGEQLVTPGSILVQDIPQSDSRNGGALAFGPDGMLYAGTGDVSQPVLSQEPESYAGKILRLEVDGNIPADNPDPDSYVYSSGHTDVQGLAWDPAGRLWVVDAGDGTEANPAALSVISRDAQDGTVAPPMEIWQSDDPASQPTGLAYGNDSRSLWMTTAAENGVWRIPLDGEGGLVADPVLLPSADVAEPSDVIPAASNQLWVLTGGDGRLLRLDIE